MSDVRLFLSAFLRSPAGVGAVAPSSRALAIAIADAADLAPDEVVAELGAGTGPFTEVLLERIPAGKVLALEPDPVLAARCRARNPRAEVVEAFADRLPALLAERGHGRVRRIVSGLPFASWTPAAQDAVFDAVAEALQPDGRFVTFTYVQSPWLPAGRRARSTLQRRFTEVRTTPVVWSNVPPAFVYVCDGPRGGR